MATKLMQGEAPTVIEHDFSWLQKYVIRRFHPRSIFVDSVGLVWFTFFLWNHDWKTGLGVAVFARIIALASVMNINTDLFAESVLGKIGLLHLNPFNLAIQLVGTVGLLYGIWEHSTETILGGISFILLGHFFGWSKVHPKLGDMEK